MCIRDRLAAEPSVAEPTSGEFAPGLGKTDLVHIIAFGVFQITHPLFLVAGAEATGEQGEHYDPLFTYGAAAGSPAHSEESGSGAADVGPSGVGTSKGSLRHRALSGGPQDTRQVKASRLFVLILPKIFRWCLWRLMWLARRLRRRHLMVLS